MFSDAVADIVMIVLTLNVTVVVAVWCYKSIKGSWR